MISFPEIDEVFTNCEDLLNSSTNWGKPIETYLTKYLLILIYYHFENKIREIITETISKKCPSPEIQTLISPFIDNIIKRLKTSEIRENIVKKFGGLCENRFKEECEKNPTYVVAFNNIVVNRNTTAHNNTSNITFTELKSSYSDGINIIQYLSDSLALY